MHHEPTIVMYSPDTVGLGHVRRNSTIAREVMARSPGASVVLLMGSPAGQVFDLPAGVDSIKLPSVQKTIGGDWRARSLQLSNETTQRIRGGLIRETIASLRPDIFLVDHLPAGIWGELVPVFEFIRAKRLKTKVVLGLRDIIDDPVRVAARWNRDHVHGLIGACYDTVMIYGEERVFASADAYGLNRSVCRDVRYAGYVTAPLPAETAARPARVSEERHVVVTGGGGFDAFPMMQASLAALATLMRTQRIRATAVAGPLMPEEHFQALRALATAGEVELTRFNPQLKSLVRTADAVICMAGYNSMLEIGAIGTPSIVIPRSGPSLEQTMRSQLFADLGLVRHVPLESATPQHLAHAIQSQIDQPSRRPFGLNVNGAAFAAETLLDIAASSRRQKAGAFRLRRPLFQPAGVLHAAT